MLLPRSAVAATTPAVPFLGELHVRLDQPTIDRAHRLVYGLGGTPASYPFAFDTIVAFNELTGHTRIIARFPKTHDLQMLALDRSDSRLVVGDRRFVRVLKPYAIGRSIVVTYAHVVDARSGRIISTVRLSRFVEQCCVPAEGTAAVDASVHHGFVTDERGESAMLDTETGKLLARFRIDETGDNGFFDPDSAVDSGLHRLFVGVVRPPTLAVIDTRTGAVHRWALHPHSPVGDVAVDPASQRVFAIGYNRLFILDGRTGRLLHRTRVGFLYQTMRLDAPAQRVLIPTEAFIHRRDEFVLRVIDAQTDRILNTVHTPGLDPEATGAIDRSRGRFFLDGGFNYRLRVYDAQTGRLLGLRQRLHFTPISMTVDASTHRLFISGFEASGAGVFDVLDSS